MKPAPEVMIHSGLLIRPGFYRNSITGQNYARQTVKNLQGQCLFCTEEGHTVTHSGERLFAFGASAPYEFWGDKAVTTHELIVPRQHTDTIHSEAGRQILGELHDYATERRAADPTIQLYVRTPGNPSKSVEHLHFHLFSTDPSRRLAQYAFDLSTGATFQLHTTDHPGQSFTLQSVDPESQETAHDDTFTVRTFQGTRGHFDAQQVVLYEQLLLRRHTNTPLGSRAVRSYLEYREKTTPSTLRFQFAPQLPDDGQPRIDLYTLSLNPVARLAYEHTTGITALRFAELTPEQVKMLNTNHQQA